MVFLIITTSDFSDYGLVIHRGYFQSLPAIPDVNIDGSQSLQPVFSRKHHAEVHVILYLRNGVCIAIQICSHFRFVERHLLHLVGLIGQDVHRHTLVAVHRHLLHTIPHGLTVERHFPALVATHRQQELVLRTHANGSYRHHQQKKYFFHIDIIVVLLSFLLPHPCILLY